MEKTLSKEQWVSLAKAVWQDNRVLDEISEAKRRINKKYGLDTDFVGEDYGYLHTLTVAVEILGEEFDYFLYECDGDFKTFNERVTYIADGSHPDVHSMEDLYYEIIKIKEA